MSENMVKEAAKAAHLLKKLHFFLKYVMIKMYKYVPKGINTL